MSKVVGGKFVELADLLSVNLREVEQEPQTFLNGKLVVSSSKRRQVEIRIRIKKPRIPSGPYLVAGAFSNLGWPQILLHANVGARPRLLSLLGCCRLTGLWGYF